MLSGKGHTAGWTEIWFRRTQSFTTHAAQAQAHLSSSQCCTRAFLGHALPVLDSHYGRFSWAFATWGKARSNGGTPLSPVTTVTGKHREGLRQGSTRLIFFLGPIGGFPAALLSSQSNFQCAGIRRSPICSLCSTIQAAPRAAISLSTNAASLWHLLGSEKYCNIPSNTKALCSPMCGFEACFLCVSSTDLLDCSILVPQMFLLSCQFFVLGLLSIVRESISFRLQRISVLCFLRLPGIWIFIFNKTGSFLLQFFPPAWVLWTWD